MEMSFGRVIAVAIRRVADWFDPPQPATGPMAWFSSRTQRASFCDREGRLYTKGEAFVAGYMPVMKAAGDGAVPAMVGGWVEFTEVKERDGTRWVELRQTPKTTFGPQHVPYLVPAGVLGPHRKPAAMT